MGTLAERTDYIHEVQRGSHRPGVDRLPPHCVPHSQRLLKLLSAGIFLGKFDAEIVNGSRSGKRRPLRQPSTAVGALLGAFRKQCVIGEKRSAKWRRGGRGVRRGEGR